MSVKTHFKKIKEELDRFADKHTILFILIILFIMVVVLTILWETGLAIPLAILGVAAALLSIRFK